MKTREQLNTDLLLNLNANLLVNNILLLAGSRLPREEERVCKQRINEMSDILAKNKEDSIALDKEDSAAKEG